MERGQPSGSSSHRGRGRGRGGRTGRTSTTTTPRLEPPPTGFRFALPHNAETTDPRPSQLTHHFTRPSPSPTPSPTPSPDARGREHQQQQHEQPHEQQQQQQQERVVHHPVSGQKNDLGAEYCVPDKTATGFVPNTKAGHGITHAIRTNYEGFWPTWSDVPDDVRDRMFLAFQKYVWWLPENTKAIRKAFEFRARKRLTQMFNENRNKGRPSWVGEHVWGQLQAHWATESWIKKQQQRKNARKSETGGNLNCCGSLSIPTHAQRMEDKTGKKPSPAEVFRATHTKKNPETGERDIWVEDRARRTFDLYTDLIAKDDEIRSQASTQMVDGIPTPIVPRTQQEEQDIFTQAAGGVNRGRLYGTGLNTSRTRVVFHTGPSSSNAVSQEQYDQMRTQVQQLTEQLSSQTEQLNAQTEQLNAQKAQHQAEMSEVLRRQAEHETNMMMAFERFKAEVRCRHSKKKQKSASDSVDEFDTESE